MIRYIASTGSGGTAFRAAYFIPIFLQKKTIQYIKIVAECHVLVVGCS